MKTLDIFDLSGKRALITGGGAGLGAQIVEALAEAGADVFLAARKLDRCATVAESIERRFEVRASAVACDISDPNQVVEMLDAVVAELRGVDILVNNSGTSWGAPALSYPVEAWRKVLDVNLTGTFLVSQAAARQMVEQQTGGKIINIASLLGLRGAPAEMVDAVAYNASKGGVIALTKDLAVKLAPSGIGVNAIAPGWFPTDMSSTVIERSSERFLERIPAGRFGTEKDLKGAAIFLASAASDYVCGQTIVVDGGMGIS